MCQPFGNHLGWSEHGRSGYPNSQSTSKCSAALGSGSQKSTKSSTAGRWSLSDGYGKGVDWGDMMNSWVFWVNFWDLYPRNEPSFLSHVMDEAYFPFIFATNQWRYFGFVQKWGSQFMDISVVTIISFRIWTERYLGCGSSYKWKKQPWVIGVLPQLTGGYQGYIQRIVFFGKSRF